MKGGASQNSGTQNPWLGMAGMYGGQGQGGAYGGYGGYGQYGQSGQQSGQMGQAPMAADFSHGAGLYQANQMSPYYAGGQPPPSTSTTNMMTGTGTDMTTLPGGAPMPTAPPVSAQASGTNGQPPGLLGWFNRGYGTPPPGGAGMLENQQGSTGMSATQQQQFQNIMPYLSGLFGGGYRGY